MKNTTLTHTHMYVCRCVNISACRVCICVYIYVCACVLACVSKQVGIQLFVFSSGNAIMYITDEASQSSKLWIIYMNTYVDYCLLDGIRKVRMSI